ncbi:IS110 family transposase [Leptolyngbya sp. PCC 6406]|uniref:IS110 family transposase n=1 Tax=Leptolyngbya sp. PCC 6406 TaxID=1173264 RepID=UPI0002AC6F9A|nr:IS110 family transposase [Leptolyngbya sp. PCC 6406]
MNEVLIPVGIDVSKATLHVAVLLPGHNKPRYQSFENTEAGFEALQSWLVDLSASPVHACLEATSIYGHAVALALHQQGHRVSIVNPVRIHGYAKSQLKRTKADRPDATLIAEFCRDLKPSAWQPSSTEVQDLQGYTRRLDALTHMLTQEKNRLEISPTAVKSDIEAHIEFLEAQVKALKKLLREHIQAHDPLKAQSDLLVSIVGIGPDTAARLLAEIGDIKAFRSARQLAAYAGLTPQEHSSGTSVQGKTHLCKIGNARLRKALFFPALAFLRHAPQIQPWRDRLSAAGKTKMAIIGAAMHKLIRIVYGVLSSGKTYDPDKLLPAKSSPVTA